MVEANQIKKHIAINTVNALYHVVKIVLPIVDIESLHKSPKEVYPIYASMDFGLVCLITLYLLYDYAMLMLKTRAFYRDSYLEYRFKFSALAFALLFVCFSLITSYIGCRVNEDICDQKIDWLIALCLYCAPAIVLLATIDPNDYIEKFNKYTSPYSRF